MQELFFILAATVVIGIAACLYFSFSSKGNKKPLIAFIALCFVTMFSVIVSAVTPFFPSFEENSTIFSFLMIFLNVLSLIIIIPVLAIISIISGIKMLKQHDRKPLAITQICVSVLPLLVSVCFWAIIILFRNIAG